MTTAWAINVKDYGATGNGKTDDTASIQTAANLIGPNGGLLLFQPGGNYLISSPIYLKSNTTVWIYGAIITAAWPWLGLVPSGAPPGFQVGSPFQMMFVNVNWTIDSLATPIDTGIAIAGGQLNWPAPSVTGGPLGGAHSVMLRQGSDRPYKRRHVYLRWRRYRASRMYRQHRGCVRGNQHSECRF